MPHKKLSELTDEERIAKEQFLISEIAKYGITVTRENINFVCADLKKQLLSSDPILPKRRQSINGITADKSSR